MESIHRRYYHSIRSYQFVGVFLSCLLPFLCIGQDANERNLINKFLNEEFISLLQKANDYKTINNNSSSLQAALSTELNNLSLTVNPNCVIEYDKANRDGKEIIISDKILSYLINYAGRSNQLPRISIECTVKNESDFHAFFKSTAFTTEANGLSKAIFRKSQSGIELRRISFADELPSSCKEESMATRNESIPIEGVTDVATHQAILGAPNQLPRITIREATIIDGQAIIYGFVKNHKENGYLIDLENNINIRVSPRDGYFVLTKLLASSGHKELNFRYQYGDRFITDKKLVFLKQ